MLAVVLLMLGILIYTSPDVRLPRLSLITPGAGLALSVWLIASVAFALTLHTWGPTIRPTAPLAASSPCWSSCGCPTSHYYSAYNSTHNSSETANATLALRTQHRRFSSTPATKTDVENHLSKEF